MKGTGDGGMVGGSRKIKTFLWLVAAVMLFVAMVTYMRTPEQIAIQALYIIGLGGIFTIGGQSLVDSLAKWRQPQPGSTTVIQESTVKTETK